MEGHGASTRRAIRGQSKVVDGGYPARGGWKYPIATAICLVLYLAAFGVLVLLRYATLNPRNADLAIFNQTLWSTLHGRFMQSSLLGYSYLGDHMSPILLLVLPLYYLQPGPEVLLLVQTMAVASAAVPLYLIAREELGPGWVPVAFASAYLVYPATGWVNLTGFSPDAIGIPILMTLFLFLRRQSWVPFFAAAGLALMVKEDWALTMVSLGLYLGLYARLRRQGLALTLVALGCFAAYVLVAVPALTGEPYRFLTQRYNISDPDFQGRALDVLGSTWAARSSYLLLLLAPVGFLPILNLSAKPWDPRFHPNLALVALPALAENLFAGPSFQYSIQSKFAAALIPVIFSASVFGLKSLRQRLDGWVWPRGRRTTTRYIALGLVGVVLGASLTVGPLPWSMGFHPSDYSQSTRAAVANRLMELIPSNASVAVHCCPNALMKGILVKMSSRMDVHYFPRDKAGVEYLFLDASNLDPADVEWVQGVMSSGLYVRVGDGEGLLLLRLDRSQCPTAECATT